MGSPAIDHRIRFGHPGADQGHGVGVGGVGLASLTGREHPRSRGQLRWHIDHLLAGSKQPDRDVVTDPVAALDRPHTSLAVGLDPVDVTGHVGEATFVGVVTAAAQDGLLGVHDLDRGRPLCGSMPITRVLPAVPCTLPGV